MPPDVNGVNLFRIRVIGEENLNSGFFQRMTDAGCSQYQCPLYATTRHQVGRDGRGSEQCIVGNGQSDGTQLRRLLDGWMRGSIGERDERDAASIEFG